MNAEKEASFRKLYDHHYRDVVAWLRRRGMDRAMAQDVSQEVFIRVYKGLDGFEGTHSWPWIRVIAKNAWANWLRDRATQKRGMEVTTLDEVPELDFDATTLWGSRTPSPEEKASWNEKLARLNKILGTFPKRSCEVFLLRYRDGMKYREVALHLGISIDTVKSHLHQARQRIREADLEGLDEEHQD